MSDTIERGMFYNAKPDIFQKTKTLRLNMTASEKIIWNRINKGKIMGLRFKARHPIDIFIFDFYCHELKLVVEIDGDIHNNHDQRSYDEGRTAELEHFDIKVVRFKNDEVSTDIEKVINELVRMCIKRKYELRPVVSP
jgi:very-short-patch-repair endonuclease